MLPPAGQCRFTCLPKTNHMFAAAEAGSAGSLFRIFRPMLLLLFGALLAVSCNRHVVKLDYTNAAEEVPQLGNLVFRFSEDLISDSLLNKWDSTAYVEFEPAIRGQFRWEGRNQLVFSPAGPLQPATSYRARLSKLLLKGTRFGAIKGGEDVSFKTPDLKLESSHAYWTRAEGSNATLAQIDLFFNYPVDPKQLQDKLSALVDGQQQSYELLTVSAQEKMTVRLSQLRLEDRDYKLQFNVGKGLVPVGGKNGLPAVAEYESVLTSPFVLSINELSAEHDGVTGTILVKTSQPLMPAAFASLIRIAPAVRFSTEITEDGLLISSDQFGVENSYSISFAKGMKGTIGGVLKEEYSSSVAFGKLEPNVSFASGQSVYLGKNGARNIEVRISNVPRVKVIVSKIFESNLLAAHRYGYYPKEKNADSEDYYYEGEGNAVMGDVVYEAEIDTRSLPRFGNSRLFQFNLTDRLSDLNGIYHIKIRSTDDYWISDSRFIALSDIGLIARQGADKVFVFANSIQSAAAISNASISVYGANNQLLGKGSTNAEGVAEIPLVRQEFAGFKPAMIIAKTGTDFNYLPFHNTGVNTSRFEVGGKRMNGTGLDAFVYAERDIYRPGEQMNLAAIVRDRSWKSPGSLPVKIKVLMPNGKELTTLRKNLNSEGAVEANVALSGSALTGSYVVELYNGNDILLASKTMRVEAFMPDRIKLQATPDKASAAPGETVKLAIQAANYFGPPAAGRKYECEIQVRRKQLAPKRYNRFSFAIDERRSIYDNLMNEGSTNDAGGAQVVFAVPDVYKATGLLEARFFTTVFDETGRPVSRVSQVDLHTQPVYFGIATGGYNYFPLRQAIRFPVIALSKAEQPTAATAQVQVIKHEYRTVLSRAGSYFRYESYKDDKLLINTQQSISGEQSSFSFTPTTPGEYEVRLSLPGADSYVSQTFYSYGGWGNADAAFEVNREGHVDISLDKESYSKGETVKALFKAPFNGRLLVTVETDKVVQYRYVDVTNRSATVDLKVDEAFLPNAYISATLFKPHGVSDMPLTVAHGYQNIKVTDADKQMKVAISAGSQVRSRTRQRVVVKAAPNAMVSLAAVDNGVLAVSNFKTPDPYQYFFAQRALGVSGYDLYPLLFPELRRTLSSSGGDAEGSLDQRMNPMPDKRVKLLSYWSGLKQAGSNGEAVFEFDIPQFSGQVRLMAVAAKDNRFGGSEASMTVADPLVLSTALPRFLSPGDTVLMPLTVANTTGKATAVNARLLTEGGLRVVDAANASATVEGKREATLLFKLVAAPNIGTAKVRAEVTGMGEKFVEETDLSIRPAAPLQKMTGVLSLPANTSQAINIPVGDFMPGSLQYQLTLSRHPALQLGSQLQYLLTYPYGCTEQTISIAFPQLYFADLANMLHTGQGQSRTAVEHVQEAIRKIKMRQLYNGAITLWDGEGYENWWLTAYAAHFLLEAKKAGYEVDRSLLETMLGYLSLKLRNRQTIAYYYNRTLQKKIAPKEVAYSLYVLALAGRPNIATMNYYKANQPELALDSRYLLATSYGLAGDKQRMKELMPSAFAGEEAVPSTGGSFYSDIRDEALALNALLDLEPNHPQIPVMAKHVADKLNKRSWYSTQEASFGLLAMGKIARRTNGTTATAQVLAAGKNVGTMSGAPLVLRQQQLGSPALQVVTKGSGTVYAWWQSSGISASGSYKEEDSYLKVRRSFYDRYGRPLSGNTFRQNDLIVVRISLEKAYSGNIDNIVVTDLLPAGFEIENPRIKELPGTEWIKDASQPDHLDIRDDRVHFFTNLSDRRVFYYSVRAVSPGQYKLGPVAADAMYNGEYHSYHGAGTVRVLR